MDDQHSRFQGGRGLAPQGVVRQGQHAVQAPVPLGDTAMRPVFFDAPQYASYNKVMTEYVIQATLGPEAGNSVKAQVQLRPEPFLLHRVTYATTGDILTPQQLEDIGGEGIPGVFPTWSQQARSVEIEWGDEFTRFMGTQPALVAAIFADSSGYLDLPQSILFQGSQNLSLTLTRLAWPLTIGGFDGQDPAVEFTPINTQWDFIFEGVALFPQGVNQSGSE